MDAKSEWHGSLKVQVMNVLLQKKENFRKGKACGVVGCGDDFFHFEQTCPDPDQLLVT